MTACAWCCVFGQIMETVRPPRVTSEEFRKKYRPRSWDFNQDFGEDA